MKNHLPGLFLLLAAVICIFHPFSRANAQSIAEGFESGLPTSPSTTTADFTLSSGVWNIYNASSSSDAKSGSLSLQLQPGSNPAPTFAAAPSVSAVTSVSFWAKANAKSKIKVQKSVNGGSYSDITTLNLSTSYASFTVNVNETSSDVRIRFANPNSQTLFVDEVSITGASTSPSPAIATSVSSLPDFGNVEVNTTSTAKSYSVSGTALTPSSGSITVSAPTGFEVSASSGSGFGSSITLAYSGGALAATTVYVRFNPTLAQTYTGNITHDGGGAANKSVAVSGTGTSSSGSGGTGTNAWYVSPSGNDTNAGTLASPFKTIPKAVSVASPGEIIYVRGGSHVYTAPINISKSGTSSNKLYLLAYQNERPVLNFSGMSVSSSNRGMNLSGSYWEIKGIDFYKAGDNGMYMSGSNNRIEFCSFYENYDTGLQLGGGASYNQIINCDSYYNADINNGNADGFAPKLDVGTGNYFYGCRAWQNSDDGWDGYMRGNDDVTTTLENCWVFKSGYLKSGSASTGNGNGFKMGGSDDKTLSHNMILKNCLAFQNRDKGFDQNSNTGSMTLYNSTAFGNARNYVITTALRSGKTLNISNSVSAGTGTISLGSFAVQQTNSWMSGFTVTNDDFISVDPAAAYGPRKADGSLPDITFMHLAAGSDLIDRGTNVGLAYNGSAPDLGCFESNYTSTSLVAAVQVAEQLNKTLVNFPNPFPASTTLQFNVTEGGIATVKVLNLLGQEVAVLFNDSAEAGKVYKVTFDAGALPAGIYLGVLEQGGRRTVQKMLLAK